LHGPYLADYTRLVTYGKHDEEGGAHMIDLRNATSGMRAAPCLVVAA
jgi:hypothetical protein